jgi:hypothetical protein
MSQGLRTEAQISTASEGLRTAQAASGGGEGEPVAWARLLATANPKEFFWCDIEETYGDPGDPEFDLKNGETVVPLYRAPPLPRGWLTEAERESLEHIVAAIRPSGSSIYRDEIRAVESLLARSTPPEVVAPASYALEHPRPPRYLEWREALAAAGVPVKEVGRD